MYDLKCFRISWEFGIVSFYLNITIMKNQFNFTDFRSRFGKSIHKNINAMKVLLGAFQSMLSLLIYDRVGKKKETR
jgi:hypothetical protein